MAPPFDLCRRLETCGELDPAVLELPGLELELLPELSVDDGFVVVEFPLVDVELKRAANCLFANPDNGFVTLAPPIALNIFIVDQLRTREKISKKMVVKLTIHQRDLLLVAGLDMQLHSHCSRCPTSGL
jgi:hypothetical protein